MKKYSCLILAIALAVFAAKFDWYLSGNESVAAAKQVLNGDQYLVGRATQEMWGTIKGCVMIAAGIFGLSSAYLFITAKPKQNNENNETEQ
jgi:hypothetical protein